MTKLLKVDLYKLFRMKSFYIIGIIIFSIFSFDIFSSIKYYLSDAYNNLGSNFNLSEDSLVVVNSEFKLNFFSEVLKSLYRYIPTLSSIFAVLFVCSDFSSGSIKNFASKGFNRISIYLSKFIVSLCSIVFYAIPCLLSATVISFSIATNPPSGFYQIPKDFFLRTLLVLISFAAYISLAFMISYLLKRTGPAVALLFGGVFFFFPLVIGLIDSFLAKNFKSITFKLSEYTLSSSLSHIVFEDFSSLPQHKLLQIILVPITYILISSFIGILYFKKKDLDI